MQELFIEEDFNLRTKEDHAVQVELVETTPTNFLKEFYSQKCGVTFRSKLIEAPFFDVTYKATPIRKYREKVLPTWDKRHKKLWLLASILLMILAKYVDKNSTPWE
ncbi:unnamed protein product [Porites lobata]|uniref:Uncharacterized protein n=1 Tax=Porites lobata TaxID=104759 RepID=A0ABN8Q927_9CNID|nr:unnamed protein product [Porites lobata]